MKLDLNQNPPSVSLPSEDVLSTLEEGHVRASRSPEPHPKPSVSDRPGRVESTFSFVVPEGSCTATSPLSD